MCMLLLQALDDLRRFVEATVRVLSANIALWSLSELLYRALFTEVVTTAKHHPQLSLLRCHNRIHELLSANEASEWKLFLIATLDHVFVILVIIIHIYSLSALPNPTLSSLALLSLLLLLLFPVAVLLLIPPLQRNNLPTHLIVATIVNKLARIAERAVACFLVVLTDFSPSSQSRVPTWVVIKTIADSYVTSRTNWALCSCELVCR